MKFREHRGGLGESMKTVVEVADFAALLTHMRKLAQPWPTMPPINATTVHIIPYLYDARIGWDTYLVRLDGYGPFGFTDGPAT